MNAATTPQAVPRKKGADSLRDGISQQQRPARFNAVTLTRLEKYLKGLSENVSLMSNERRCVNQRWILVIMTRFMDLYTLNK